MDTMCFRIVMNEGNGDFETLKDILPDEGSPNERKLKMLIIGKRPAPVSVRVGHYFQGRQGKMFWNQLRRYDIIQVPKGRYEDECLLEHKYGIMDIVKKPGEAGDEPSDQEYERGIERIRQAIHIHEPDILLFVYKPPLEKFIKMICRVNGRPSYGYNPSLEKCFGSKVLLCPLPGVKDCSKKVINAAMTELGADIKWINNSHKNMSLERTSFYRQD